MIMQFDLYNAAQNNILDAKSYSEFRQALITSNCDLCTLSQKRQNIVVDRGTPNTEIVIVANLEPRSLMGLESQGMLLAASDNEKTKLVLIRPGEETQPGSLIG